VHVLEGVEQLLAEEEADLLAHGVDRLAHVEKEPAHVLHLDEDEVADDAAGLLDDGAVLAVTVERDNIFLIEVLENGDFVPTWRTESSDLFRNSSFKILSAVKLPV